MGSACFDDSDWSPASAANSNRSRHVPGELRALPIPPIRVTAKLTPVSVSEVAPGMYIFDLGQKLCGLGQAARRGTARHNGPDAHG